MTVAIHQPNFFPWLGFFNKIAKADKFVYLDHTENNPRSAIYTKRVKIIVNKNEHWLTLSLKSDPSKIFFAINEMRIDKPAMQKDKHLKTLELSYKKAPHFNEVFPLVQSYYEHPSELVAERNMSFIDKVCDKLNISTKKTKSSELGISSSSNQLLVDLVKGQGGDCYMPGGGAEGYQEDDFFEKSGIKLQYQNFRHPVYEQFNSDTFIAGLSIIDVLMNKGFGEAEILIKNA